MARDEPPGTRKPSAGQPVYRPDIFDVDDLDRARQIILTPEPKTTTDERWERETPFLVRCILEHLAPGRGDVVLDYGCGVGRLARELIRQAGCDVLGVDISRRMRSLAVDYVDSPRFTVLSPRMFETLIAKGLRVDHGIAVWVLQHCHSPDRDIALIAAALAAGHRLFVVNGRQRCVPSDRGWVNDRLDIAALLALRFTATGDVAFESPAVSPELAQSSFARIYAKAG
ncbi:MAG: class I SAM-dependent methyltransferase [Alphaproteobacteria bacterium]